MWGGGGGGEQWIRCCGHVLRDENGQAARVIGVAFDISERKAAEKVLLEWNKVLEERVHERTRDLRTSEARCRLLSEATFEGVVITSDGVIQDANPQVAAMFGYSPDEMVGMNAMDIVALDSRPILLDRISNGRTELLAWTGLRKDGSRFPVESRARIVEHPDGSLLRVGVVRDMTEDHRLKARMERQQMELDQARKLALFSEIGSGIIHEISQPLGAAGANLAAAAAGITAQDPHSLQTLQIIHDAISELSRVRETVQHLRLLTFPRPSARALVSPNEMVEGVLFQLHREAESHCAQLSVDLADELPDMPLDLVQMKHVVLNLVSNGLAACTDSAEGVRIVRIATGRTEGGDFCLCVRDSGTGLLPQVRKNLFKPFFSTKANGSGVGLRLCQTIVSAHNGSIEVENNPDGPGATFRVLIPLAPARTEAPATRTTD